MTASSILGLEMNLLPKIFPRTTEEREAEFERQLIKNEAEIGEVCYYFINFDNVDKFGIVFFYNRD